jgi:MarR family transcriptional regulator, negative regulator of the multidrug operon emrRAB
VVPGVIITRVTILAGNSVPYLDLLDRGLDRVRARHPEMPRGAVMLARLGYHVFRLMNDRLETFFDYHGLTSSAWTALMIIYASPGRAVSPSQMSASLAQSRTHMTRVGDELVEKGLAQRVPDSADRRRVQLALSPRGERLVRKLLPLAWREYEGMLSGFSERDAATLERLLRRWITHLEDASPLSARAGKVARIRSTEHSK